MVLCKKKKENKNTMILLYQIKRIREVSHLTKTIESCCQNCFDHFSNSLVIFLNFRLIQVTLQFIHISISQVEVYNHCGMIRVILLLPHFRTVKKEEMACHQTTLMQAMSNDKKCSKSLYVKEASMEKRQYLILNRTNLAN